jgi:hypothetical protein
MTVRKMEGKLPGCKKTKCNYCCCDNDRVDEWIIEYAAFHEKIKKQLLKKGIKLSFYNDRIRISNCSDGKNCKFLTEPFNKTMDLRPIDCKIYPYAVDWNTIDFDKKIVNLYYWDYNCPMVTLRKISPKFKEEVKRIIQRDFSFLFHKMKFDIIFHDKILPKLKFKNL